MRDAVAGIVFLALLASTARAWDGCCQDDPSGIDVRPLAEPLRVARVAPSAELVLTWEATSAEYRVYRGDLRRLHAERALNDSEAARTTLATARVPFPAPDTYWLVSAGCNELRCSRGRDSLRRERERPGCTLPEHGDFGAAAAYCLLLGGDTGIVRTAAEHDFFAACFTDPWEPPAPPRVPGTVIAWAADEASAACGSCLELTCARITDDDVLLERAGGPWGPCDALHAGGFWTRIPDRPSIAFAPFPGWTQDGEACR